MPLSTKVMIMQRSVTYFLGASMLAMLFLLAGFDGKMNDPVKANKAAAGIRTVQPPPLPDSMHFAGESVPLDRRDVREAFDREVLYNYYAPSHILYIMKLTTRYFPMIEERLKANGVPEDMKYLCIAESSLQQLVSKAGAAGFWQFMPGTAPGYGLEVNAQVDERYHIEKSTDAACAYLKRAYNQFGSWTAAAASYNCGMGGYQSNASFQGSKHYYDLMLPDETNKYIFRILTFKYFINHADDLGFILRPEEVYAALQVKRVPVENGITNLAAFAQQQGVTYRTLKHYNPWLRGRSLPAKKGKTYILHLPAAGAVAEAGAAVSPEAAGAE